MALSDMAANFQLEFLELANIEVPVSSHFFAIEEDPIRGVR